VYEGLREQILDLRLAPGERLFEDEVSRAFGVSRTPVREAFRLLLAEELLEQMSTGGMVVPALDVADMRELYGVRAALEGLLAREAADNVDDEAVVELEELLEQMAALVEHPRALMGLGQQLHAKIADVSGNRRAEVLLHQLRGHISRYQVLTNKRPTRRHSSLDEHRAIVAALTARDGQRAERLIREHVMNAYVVAAEALRESLATS